MTGVVACLPVKQNTLISAPLQGSCGAQFAHQSYFLCQLKVENGFIEFKGTVPVKKKTGLNSKQTAIV